MKLDLSGLAISSEQMKIILVKYLLFVLPTAKIHALSGVITCLVRKLFKYYKER
jgi:hypothetical protein